MKSKFALALALAVVVGMGGVQAKAATWGLGAWQVGPNGHYYSVQAITGGTTGWLIARTQAQGLLAPDGSPVDLATITSQAEDAFVFAGVDTPAYWTIDGAGNNEGPNIGGFQTDKLAEPAGHWAWVTGEPWSYTQWNPGEPNNSSGTEDFATLFSSGSGRTGNWNDIGSGTSTVGTQGAIAYYIAESVPEPASLAILGCGAVGLLMRRRR